MKKGEDCACDETGEEAEAAEKSDELLEAEYRDEAVEVSGECGAVLWRVSSCVWLDSISLSSFFNDSLAFAFAFDFGVDGACCCCALSERLAVLSGGLVFFSSFWVFLSLSRFSLFISITRISVTALLLRC